jgi:spermidine synthase
MTYLLAGSVLLLVGGALLVRRKAALPLVLLPLLLPFGVHARLSGTPLRPSPGLLQEEESAYQYLQVVEETRSEGRRAIALTLDEGRQDYQSYMIEGDPTTGGLYYDTMTLAALLPDQAHPLEILVLGAGAGTIPRSLSMLFGERIARIDTVEIDPAVVEVGRSFFLQNLPDGPPIETWTSDGRVFLHATPRRYDAILVDVYAHQLYIPFHFTTHQFFSLARRRMKPGSILALNVSTFGADSPLLLALSQSLQAVFPRVHRTPVLGTSWNQILVASTASARRSFADLEPEEVPSPLNGVWRAARETTVEMPRVPLGSRSGPLLTDDRAPVEQLLREELAVATPLAPKRPADSWPEDDAPPEIIDVALAGKKFSEFETLWREGREDEALAAFRQAFRADPDHTAFGSWAFGTFLLSGHVKATALFFEDALARRPDDADLLYHAAWSRFHTGDPGGAMGLLERLIATSPDVETETKAWGDLGYFRFTTGDLASAGEAYRNQARLAPEDAGAAKGLEAIAEAGRCRTRTRTALVIGPLLLAGILVLGIRRPRPG